MKSAFRTRIAAALLLSPLAALVAQPALAQHRDYVVGPAVAAPAPGYGSGYGYERDHGWRPHWRRDDRAPVITEVTPVLGERAGHRHTLVGARFADDASGIDPASVHLRIDGRDVTYQARISDDEVRFRDAFAPGRHVAEVVVRDRAGNLARRSWQFDVASWQGSGYGYGWGWQR